MSLLTPRKVTLKKIETELSRINICIEETNIFLKKKLSKEKIKELEKLKENIQLLKSFEKRKSKENLLDIQINRKHNFEKAIEKMKKNKQEIYNPIKGEDWLDE